MSKENIGTIHVDMAALLVLANVTLGLHEVATYVKLKVVVIFTLTKGDKCGPEKVLLRGTIDYLRCQVLTGRAIYYRNAVAYGRPLLPLYHVRARIAHLRILSQLKKFGNINISRGLHIR